MKKTTFILIFSLFALFEVNALDISKGFACCPKTYVYDRQTLSCICPPETPNVDINNQCVPCNSPNVWNNITKTCQDVKVKAPPPPPTPPAPIPPEEECCTQDQPFVNAQGDCVSCDFPMQWEKKTKQCLQCQNGQIFGNDLRCICPPTQPHQNLQGKCQSCITGWNATAKKCNECPSDKTWSASKNQCVCPAQQPFLTANDKCIECVAPKMWFSNNKTCAEPQKPEQPKPVALPPPVPSGPKCKGKVLDQQTSQCVCPGKKPYEAANGSCVECKPPKFWSQSKKGCFSCPAGFIPNIITEKCDCPLSKPYVDSVGTCVPCATQWDSVKRQCKKCQNGQIFNVQTKECVCPGTLPNKLANGTCILCEAPNNWIPKTSECKPCGLGQSYDCIKKQCTCTIKNADGSCSKCIAPQHFNDTTLKCEECPKDTHFDVAQNKCICCPQGGYIFDSVKLKCTCPPQKPLDDSKSCKPCPEGTVYKEETKKCAAAT